LEWGPARFAGAPSVGEREEGPARSIRDPVLLARLQENDLALVQLQRGFQIVTAEDAISAQDDVEAELWGSRQSHSPRAREIQAKENRGPQFERLR